MHIFGRRLWLSAALMLLLCLSSPLTWLVHGAPRALPCCCPHFAAAVAPCCHIVPGPAPLSVAIVAPARAHFRVDSGISAPVNRVVLARDFGKIAPSFPAEIVLPPPKSATRRIGSCRAPPVMAEQSTLQEGGKHP